MRRRSRAGGKAAGGHKLYKIIQAEEKAGRSDSAAALDAVKQSRALYGSVLQSYEADPNWQPALTQDNQRLLDAWKAEGGSGGGAPNF
jgi:hypothetical protein